jgi:glycosyltransferase involved in cell wall biosynthesis
MIQKRILHLHSNGAMAAIFIAPLIEGERNQGFDSRVITSTIPLKQLGGTVIPFDLSITNIFWLPFSLIRLCYYLMCYKPNIVISHNFKSSLLPLLTARLMGISNIIYFNHGVPYVAYRGILRAILKMIEAINIHLSTEVITVSEDMKQLLHAISNKRKISLIASGSASGINLQRYTSSQSVHTPFRAINKINKDDVIFSYIGRPEIRKGFAVALNLWDQYLQKNLSYRLYLCGPSEGDVIRLTGKVSERLIPLGFAKNIPEILSNSKYLLLTSFHEGLSYAVLEAMASGCIVIANKIDGIQFLIQDGLNGFLVDNNSLEIYAQKISFIENQTQSFCQSIQQKAFKTASLFSRDIFLVAYLDFIGQRLEA